MEQTTSAKCIHYGAVVVYLAGIGIIFLGAYVLLGVREIGLYLVLTLTNLPASVALVPHMEFVAQSLGWQLGGPLHVWTTQLACMTANAVFVAAVGFIVAKLWRFVRGPGRAV